MEFGDVEYLTVSHNASKLLPKEVKELNAFCNFAKSPVFKSTVHRLTGAKLSDEFRIEILSFAKGEDPPDLLLDIGQRRLAIELSEFPPDTATLNKVMAEIRGPAFIPSFHETGGSLQLIREFMRMPQNMTAPRFSSVPKEVEALFLCAQQVIQAKDATGKSELLLLHGAAFSYPTEEVIGSVMASYSPKHLQAVVLVRQNESAVFFRRLT